MTTMNIITAENGERVVMTAEQASALWDSIHDSFVNIEKNIVEIINVRAWEPLGYANFYEAWNDRMSGVRLATAIGKARVLYEMFNSEPDNEKVALATGVGVRTVSYLREQREAGIGPEAARTARPRILPPEGKGRKSSQVSFGVDAGFYQECADLASKHGTTVTELARRGLRAQVWMLKDSE